jgi:signal transduction histidine kinase
MNRRQLYGRILVATSPLGVLTAVKAFGSESSTLLAVALWVGCAVLLAEWLWRRVGSPLAGVLTEVGADRAADARWRARAIKDEAAELAAERDRMAALLEDLSSGLGEGLLVVSDDLRIRLINPVCLRFCGAEDVRPGIDLLEILRDPAVLEVVEAAAGGDSPASLVVENPRGLWEVRAFPLRPGGAVALMSDVSLIRRATEFRRRFVQDLSHELRSPLAVMRTTVEALEDELPAQIGEILVRQVERIDRLANELNELASIETGQIELTLEDVEVASVVAEVVSDFTPEAQRAGVEVRTEVPVELACICDRRGLYRVLSNLVDNAIKYNHDGGWLEIRARRAEDSVRIRVADSGVGIPAGELQAVLQRFYRLDRARTPGTGGLGLGLAIVKHMVQQMGGSLELDSRAGVGTRVTVILPAG